MSFKAENLRVGDVLRLSPPTRNLRKVEDIATWYTVTKDAEKDKDYGVWGIDYIASRIIEVHRDGKQIYPAHEPADLSANSNREEG